jgi:hypothetical protein
LKKLIQLAGLDKSTYLRAEVTLVVAGVVPALERLVFEKN